MTDASAAEPQVVWRDTRLCVAIQARLPMSELGTLADRIPELFGWLAARGLEPAGPPFFRYRVIDMAADLQVEVGAAVSGTVVGDDAVVAGTLPAGRYLVSRHVGPPAGLEQATGALLSWAARHDLTFDVARAVDGEHWACRIEEYLTDPMVEPDTAKWVTDLAFKLADES